MSDFQYDLVFEGMDNLTPEALNDFKTFCLGELDLSSELLRDILHGDSQVIMSANHSETLKPTADRLVRMGAKVAIISVAAQQQEQEPVLELELDDMLSEAPASLTKINAPEQPQKVSTEKSHSLELTFEALEHSLSLESLESQEPVEEKKIEPVLTKTEVEVKPEESELDLELGEPLMTEVQPVEPPQLEELSEPTLLETAPEFNLEPPSSPPLPPPSKSALEEAPTLNISSPAKDEPPPVSSGPASTQHNTETKETIPQKSGSAVTTQEQRVTALKNAGEDKDFELSKGQLVLAFILGLLLLVAGNRYFGSSPSDTSVPSEVSPEIAADLNSKKPAKPAPPLLKYSGPLEFDKGQLTFNFRQLDKTTYAIQFKGSTVKPPELTPEEIAANKLPHPWISNMEASDVKLIMQKTGSSTAQGSAFIFIERGKKRSRIAGTTNVTVTPNSDGTYQAQVDISYSSEEPLAGNIDDQQIISADDQDKYKIEIKAQGSLAKLVEETPVKK